MSKLFYNHINVNTFINDATDNLYNGSVDDLLNTCELIDILFKVNERHPHNKGVKLEMVTKLEKTNLLQNLCNTNFENLLKNVNKNMNVSGKIYAAQISLNNGANNK